MIKKLFLLIAMLAPLAMQAQLTTGEWFSYPIFTGSVSKLCEANNGKCYFLADTSLFSYDPESGELYSYTKRNLLNDNSVRLIEYNREKGYLLVVYANNNMDLIFDDNRVANLSDIKDAVMMTAKNINQVAFKGDRMYITTSFGLVVFDTKDFYVVESGVYNLNLTGVAVLGDNIVIYNPADSKLYYSPVNVPHFTFDSFVALDQCEYPTMTVHHLYTIPGEDNTLYSVNNSTYDLRAINVDFAARSINNLGNLATSLGNKFNVWNDAEGNLIASHVRAATVNKIKNRAVTESFTAPDNLNRALITGAHFPAKIWSFKDQKISQYGYANNTLTTLISPFEPKGACNVQNVGRISMSKDGKRIYVTPIGPAHNLGVSSNQNGYDAQGYVNILEDGEIVDATVEQVPETRTQTAFQHLSYGHKMVVAPAFAVEALNDPDTYFMGSFTEGVYKMKRNSSTGVFECEGEYTHENSPIRCLDGSETAKGWGGCQVGAVAVDNHGNLWVSYAWRDANITHVSVAVLPYEKTKLNPSQITAADWREYPHFPAYTRDANILVCKKSNMIFALCGYYSTRLMAIDTKGTADVNDDEYLVWESITDQDGKTFNFEKCVGITEDANGHVWISGNATGVIEITNPSQATNPNMTATRVKVPRNDGTDYADYLFETESVTSIATDPANRKWFSTMDSGVYLVSPAGDQILEHYTADNSYLPDNKVITVFCDPHSNRVYMGTVYGLTLYNSTSSPSNPDFNNVYAYPNPVRPEYTGWITINGLMENSLVKIADSMGATVFQGQSQGGMMMWDGCDLNGNRVKSGVYYVYASSSASDSNTGKVATKILVVN